MQSEAPGAPSQTTAPENVGSERGRNGTCITHMMQTIEREIEATPSTGPPENRRTSWRHVSVGIRLEIHAHMLADDMACSALFRAQLCLHAIYVATTDMCECGFSEPTRFPAWMCIIRSPITRRLMSVPCYNACSTPHVGCMRARCV